MSQPAGFDVPAGDRREPSAAARFARRTFTDEHADPALDDQEPTPARTVPLRAVLDVASGVLITAGLIVGTVDAWHAGGMVPGLAVLAGSLIVLGFLLNG